MSVNFLLQVTRILHVGNYDDTEVRMMYDYLRNLDNMALNDYYSSNAVIQYETDLDYCIEIIDGVIGILEEKEEYEKCQVLFTKKQQAMAIKEQKHQPNEHI